MREDITILQAMERDNGTVTPERVVQAARAADHVWHHRFIWDDAAAAHQHRLDQARTLIRSVRYVVRHENRVLSTVAYVRDPDAAGDEQAYVSVSRLATDEDRARAAILAEFARVASALRRARDLAAVLGVVDRIEETLMAVEGLSFSLRNEIEAPEARQ